MYVCVTIPLNLALSLMKQIRNLTFEPRPGYNLPPRHADWAVVSPGSQVYAQYASTTPLHAANVKFNQKNGKHLKVHKAAHVEFVPYIIESTLILSLFAAKYFV